MSKSNFHTTFSKPGTPCEPIALQVIEEKVTVSRTELDGLVQRAVDSYVAALPFYQTECMTVQQAAAQLKCFPDTIRGYIRSGMLTAVKIGNDYRIRIADLIKFLQNNQTMAVVKRLQPKRNKAS